MKVICFGDSNTYGYDPRSYFGGRFEENWVSLLGEKTGWQMYNQGMNGREIPAAAVSFPPDTDLLIMMLGTNDLLQGNSPETAARRMEAFLTGISIDRKKMILIAPPPLTMGEWVSDDGLIERSGQLTACYESLAGRLGIRFLDAGSWDIPLCFDGVHFTQEGHYRFAQNLAEQLR